MKISIGTKIKEGPWGGGNLFAINLKQHLEERGYEVINNLDDEDIDVILITEPRKTSESSAFTHMDVLNYLSFVNEETMVVHRINECDERKGTNYVNRYMIEANKVANFTVFVSSWIQDLYINQGITSDNYKVVLSGANKDIFNEENFNPWEKNEKIKIVTHHWGGNWNKGFDTYLELDNLLSKKKWSELLEFTYIGNLPKNFQFKNAKTVAPLSGKELSNEIKKHNLYLTGSKNEPSGNHHIEAAQCGLPLLFIDSGGIPEYCKGFGVRFNDKNFEKKLSEMIDNYDIYAKSMKDYPHNSEKMSKDYEKIFQNLINNKNEHLKSRGVNLRTNRLSKLIYNLIRSITN